MDNPWRYPRYLVSILLSLPIHGAAAESLLPLPPASPAATSAPPELHPCWLEPASGTLGAPFVISQGASMAREEGSDPFQPFAKVKGGVDQGRPIKTDLFRPIQILSPSIARNYGLQPRPGEIFIANLNHRNQFYVAGIPLDAISQAIYQIQKFYKPVPILAHGQVRLKFKEPVILRSQRNKEEPTIETNDLVFSIHATGADHAYDPIIKGTDGSYALVLGVFTTETKIIENARRGFSVEQWKLNLSPQQKRAYVRRYLELRNP